MRILFDHVTPAGIARFLAGHTVIKAKDCGWDTLSNGDLLAEAERAVSTCFLPLTKAYDISRILRVAEWRLWY